jgi:dTDP-4-amino-4,6-dideoxygalactose transaminase
MKFIDLAAQQKRIREKIENNITTVLDHGQYIMGPEVEKLEERLAEFVGVKHAISCSSGTDALLMALMAYNVGQGDAIFTTPFTFIATAEVISFLGAIPIFVDIDPRTFNIDPDKLEQAILALKVNDHKLHPVPITRGQSSIIPRGIIAVDLFGLPADYERINAVAKKHDILVVEDAAQSFGGEYKGKKSCSLADVACASFFPAKPLGCYGDGGMCFSDDKELIEIIESIRIHGKGHHKYDNVRIGMNGRMDTLQAAILLAKFEIFPEEIELRNQVARNYSELISAANKELSTPFVPYGYKSVWAQYSILAKNEKQRTDMQNRLKEVGIPTTIYYPIPLHLQTAFDGLGYKKGDFPISEDISRRIFSLPMHPYLKEEDQKNIAEIILEV